MKKPDVKKPSAKKPEEPGYWAERVGAAETYTDLFEAMGPFREQLGARFRPFDVLVQRLLYRFGQQKTEKDKTPEREAAIAVLTEVSLYLALVGSERAGFTTSMITAAARKALSEVEADLVCMASSLKGYERTQAELSKICEDAPASPTARKHASLLSDGDKERELEIAKVIQLAIEEAWAAQKVSGFTGGGGFDYEVKGEKA